MRRLLLLAALATLAHPALAAGPAKAGKTVQVTVTEDGYLPDKIEAKRGEPLTLVVTRKTDRTCATELVVKEYGINAPLPLGKPVTVTFTPTRAGQVKFACAMDMTSGTIIVQ